MLNDLPHRLWNKGLQAICRNCNIAMFGTCEIPEKGQLWTRKTFFRFHLSKKKGYLDVDSPAARGKTLFSEVKPCHRESSPFPIHQVGSQSVNQLHHVAIVLFIYQLYEPSILSVWVSTFLLSSPLQLFASCSALFLHLNWWVASEESRETQRCIISWDSFEQSHSVRQK